MKNSKTAIHHFQSALCRKFNQCEVSAMIAYQFEYGNYARTYSSDQYPASGIFHGMTTPWFNTMNAVPPSWLLTDEDNSLNETRAAQVLAENTYIQEHVPAQADSGHETAIEALWKRYEQLFDPAVFPPEQIRVLTEHWIHDDAEFARQRLGGANPNVMAKYQGDEQTLNQWVDQSQGTANKSRLLSRLQQAYQSGRLFVCDYRPVLSNIEKNHFVQTQHKPDYMQDGFSFAVPVAFFEIDASSQELMPLVIQIDSTNQGYLFTSEDGPNAWLLAKMWTASADAQWWFSGSHLFNSHSIDMIFAIAALQLEQKGIFTDEHPLFTLMVPHLKKIFNINSAIYNPDYDPDKAPDDETNLLGLYQPGGFCDQFLPTGRIGIFQLIEDLYQNYTFDSQAFDQNLVARGMDKDSFPGSFPYRDDGIIWWETIQSFVSDMIDKIYASDESVQEDEALNRWMMLVQEAFNQGSTERFRWTPTVAYTKQVMTNLFFLTTVQHTAVNDPMFDSLGFIPNGPFAMHTKPPEKGAVGEIVLLNSLPDPQLKSSVPGLGEQFAWPLQNQINFVMNGTAEVSDVVAAFDYQFSDPALQEIANQFHLQLEDVQMKIQENQVKRIDKYKDNHPDPKTVPNSVRYDYLTVRLQEGSTTNAPVMNTIQI
ncbi:lipoxygenase family protein [Vibrio quintilis]|uniref:Linoleate 9/13-lipoxygenase n=1 Tax=Vibrio quintilis TaxID=1117707 RepID=A0A1M7Z1S9_9VIBR|nr:lipoxygenase family protein [Vibrio quintilis]SHO58919.1 Linoleate 9/13-lipoxygenase precursor [Vibrio quintilis]